MFQSLQIICNAVRTIHLFQNHKHLVGLKIILWKYYRSVLVKLLFYSASFLVQIYAYLLVATEIFSYKCTWFLLLKAMEHPEVG